MHKKRKLLFMHLARTLGRYFMPLRIFQKNYHAFHAFSTYFREILYAFTDFSEKTHQTMSFKLKTTLASTALHIFITAFVMLITFRGHSNVGEATKSSFFLACLCQVHASRRELKKLIYKKIIVRRSSVCSSYNDVLIIKAQ